MNPSILTIKLGALGDVFQALPYMAALSLKYPTHILTSPAFLPLFERWPRFRSVLAFPRDIYRSFKGVWTVAESIRALNVTAIADFQNRGHTQRLFWALKLQGWKGLISSRWTGLKVEDQELSSTLRTQLSYISAVQCFQQLSSDFENIPSLREVLFPQGFPEKEKKNFALVPGCSLGREEKRWPLEFFKDLASDVVHRGFRPLVIGSEAERKLGETLTTTGALNLCGQTSLLDLITLCPTLMGASGNDTGPMHLFSGVDIPCLTTFGQGSNPLSHGARGSTFLLASP